MQKYEIPAGLTYRDLFLKTTLLLAVAAEEIIQLLSFIPEANHLYFFPVNRFLLLMKQEMINDAIVKAIRFSMLFIISVISR